MNPAPRPHAARPSAHRTAAGRVRVVRWRVPTASGGMKPAKAHDRPGAPPRPVRPHILTLHHLHTPRRSPGPPDLPPGPLPVSARPRRSHCCCGLLRPLPTNVPATAPQSPSVWRAAERTRVRPPGSDCASAARPWAARPSRTPGRKGRAGGAPRRLRPESPVWPEG
eukprot:scaffold27285_cov107-Isochrysis_galbana.AAC.2